MESIHNLSREKAVLCIRLYNSGMTRQMTSLRETMVRLLREQGPLTVPELVVALSKIDLHPNKTTVYRALEFLTKQQVVCLQSMGTDIAYVARENEKEYFICQHCGKVLAMPPFAHDIQLPQFAGGVVDHIHLTAFGQCTECQLRLATKE